MRHERGQASVELLGAVPALMLLGFVLFQLLAVGYASVLAGSAAEAGALALAGGTDPRAAALRSLPGWSEAHTKIDVEGGRVEIRLRPPLVLQALGERLEVGAAAQVEEP